MRLTCGKVRAQTCAISTADPVTKDFLVAVIQGM